MKRIWSPLTSESTFADIQPCLFLRKDLQCDLCGQDDALGSLRLLGSQSSSQRTTGREEVASVSSSDATQWRAGGGEAIQIQRVLSRLVTLKIFVLLQRYATLKVARRRSVQKMRKARLSRHIRAVFPRWHNLVAQTRRLRILEGKPLYRSLVAITCEMVLKSRVQFSEKGHEERFKQDVQADLLRALRNTAEHGTSVCPEVEVIRVSVCRM